MFPSIRADSGLSEYIVDKVVALLGAKLETCVDLDVHAGKLATKPTILKK